MLELWPWFPWRQKSQAEYHHHKFFEILVIKILCQPKFLYFSIYALWVMKSASQMFGKLKGISDSGNNSSFIVGHYFFWHQLAEGKQRHFSLILLKQFIFAWLFYRAIPKWVANPKWVPEGGEAFVLNLCWNGGGAVLCSQNFAQFSDVHFQVYDLGRPHQKNKFLKRKRQFSIPVLRIGSGLYMVFSHQSNLIYKFFTHFWPKFSLA